LSTVSFPLTTLILEETDCHAVSSITERPMWHRTDIPTGSHHPSQLWDDCSPRTTLATAYERLYQQLPDPLSPGSYPVKLGDGQCVWRPGIIHYATIDS
jgi:hypothetical protein